MYPYEYMDKFTNFFDGKLPDRCKFSSYLKDGCISEKDYIHAINVWNVFKMNKIVDYHDLSLKIDVLWLVHVFKKFISIWLQLDLNPQPLSS